jgi:nitrite reductase/ring-hydroxylating ferredoxin subunit
MSHESKPAGPDLTFGIAQNEIADGKMILGHVGEDDVVLVQCGADFFAVSAYCTHYHGPLAEGIVVDGTVRCPWHHACFHLRTGEALRAPALSPIACWDVEQNDGKIFVREKRCPCSKVYLAWEWVRRLIVAEKYSFAGQYIVDVWECCEMTESLGTVACEQNG